MPSLSRPIVVSEIFGPVLQGEGALIGRPTLFVRTGGCDYRCAWCDTLYAVLPEHRASWSPMSVDAILQRLDELSGHRPMMVTLSGGNPALQPLSPLIEAGHAKGYQFAMETQGSVARPWFAKLDYLILSPKPPSAGMKMGWAKLSACLAAAQGAVAGDTETNETANGANRATTGPELSLKVVVFDEADYQFAREVNRRYPGVPFYLQVGNPTLEGEDVVEHLPQLASRLRQLSERVLADGWPDVAVLPQMHVLMYGNKRGV